MYLLFTCQYALYALQLTECALASLCDSPAANYLVNSLYLTLYMPLHVKSRLPRRPKCRELVTNRCYMYLGLMSQYIGELVPVMNVIIHFLRDCTLE